MVFTGFTLYMVTIIEIYNVKTAHVDAEERVLGVDEHVDEHGGHEDQAARPLPAPEEERALLIRHSARVVKRVTCQIQTERETRHPAPRGDKGARPP